MKKIHSEIYLSKTIDVFKEYNDKYLRYDYTVQIDGANSNFKESRNCYSTIGRAVMVAKKSIKRNMSKDDEIKRLEDEIAELQAKLESLRNA